MKKVLILCSGPTALQYLDYPYKEKGWVIVAVNNGHLATKEWDYWIHSDDYEGFRPTSFTSNQQKIKSYTPSVNKFGGQKECGYSTTLSASYAALDLLKPKVIGYLGADMNYTPNEKGETHIYGVGLDIKKHGISDPDRMVEYWSKGNPNYLEDIYKRFERIAQEHGCEVYNLSKDIETRLPYGRKEAGEIDGNF